MTQDEMIAWVQAQFSAQADAKKAQEMGDYMKTSMPFYGVSAPERNQLLRELKTVYPITSSAQLIGAVEALWAQPHREERYIAISLAKTHKKYIEWSHLDVFEVMIREGAWWDFVDMIASHLIGKLIALDQERGMALMDEWVMDEDMWIRRTAIIAQLGRKQHTDAERLFSYCALRMDEKEFFIRKAIGWALRAYSRVDPDAVMAFLEEHKEHLSGLSYREGAKHMRKKGLMD